MDPVDFDVLVYTNTTPERAGAAADGADAYTARLASLFDRLTDTDRQRAVVNVEGERASERAS